MVAILAIILLYVVLQVLLLASAVVIGIGLRWCFPDLSVGHGILIGMFSTIASAYLLVQFAKVANIRALSDEYLDDEDDEDEEDEEGEEGEEGPNDTLPDVRTARPPTPRERRQRGGKQR
jgi:hypothetical protein